ncbi:MAG: immunoglobulin domain-containing protein [Phycisphaeraceae bacterium]|nr:immunoglobulin domain-containing protein [Phycisphaeraceae bacterium]
MRTSLGLRFSLLATVALVVTAVLASRVVAQPDQVLVPFEQSLWRTYPGTTSTENWMSPSTSVFDDSSWLQQSQPFGGYVGGECIPPFPVQSPMPFATGGLFRKRFTVPCGATNVRVRVAIDNDVQVWWNGVDISGGLQTSDTCPVAGQLVFAVPQSLVTTNVILAVQLINRGGGSYLAAQVEADLQQPAGLPVITSQPQPTNAQFGSDVSLTVAASGFGVTFPEWYRNGIPVVAGPTGFGSSIAISGSTLTITSVSDTDEGYYNCRVANPCGSVVSAQAQLTVFGAECNPRQLVGLWSFEGDAQDRSGAGNHGTLLGDILFVPGVSGLALRLEGIGSVMVPDAPSLNPVDSISLCAWFRPFFDTVGTSDDPIIDKGIGGAFVPPYYQYHLGIAGPRVLLIPGNVRMSADIGGSLQTGASYPAARATTSQWSQLVAVYDGQAIKVYINGVLASTTPATGPLGAHGQPLRFGRFNQVQSPSEYLRGDYDEIRIYRGVLSPSDIIYLRDHPSGEPSISAGSASCTGQTLVLAVDGVAVRVAGSYRWRKNGLPLADGPTGSGSIVSGALSPALRVSNAQPSDSGNYDVQFVDGCGSSATIIGPAQVVAIGPPAVAAPPESGTLCSQSPVVLTARTGPTSQSQAPAVLWRRNGVPLSAGPTGTGSTLAIAVQQLTANPYSWSTTLTISNSGPADAGAYTCTLTNACGPTTTAPATMAYCPADADCNGTVAPADIAVFIATWLDSLANGTLAGDFDRDGTVTPTDIAAFVAAWLNALTNGC